MINILPAVQAAILKIEQDTGLKDINYAGLTEDEDLLEELTDSFYSFIARSIQVSNWNLDQRVASVNETIDIKETIVKEILRREGTFEESIDDVAEYVMCSSRFAESFLKVLSSMVIDKLPDLDPEKMDRFDGAEFLGKYGTLSLYSALIEMNRLRTLDYENYDEVGYFIHPRTMMSYLPENAVDILIDSLTHYGEAVSTEIEELEHLN